MEQSIADARYEKAWHKYLYQSEQNPNLNITEFLRSERVNKEGFNEWMKSHGYTFQKHKYRIRKANKESDQLQEKVEMTELANNSDYFSLNLSNDYNTTTLHFWWLNINPEIWDIDSSLPDDEKSIRFFKEETLKQGKSSKNQKETKILDEKIKIEREKKFKYEIIESQFLKWLYCYLVDRKDNPHLGQPIAKRELAISLLDYCKIEVDMMSIGLAQKCIRTNLKIQIPPTYIVNPEIVLKTNTDKNSGFRHCAAWQYPKGPDGFSIALDNEGNRRPRELVKKASYPEVYYFYRKTEIPNHEFDLLHQGDLNYVQEASEIDLEKDYPQICELRPFLLANAGDLVFACSTHKKSVVAMLKVISIREDQIDFGIVNYFDTPFHISSLGEPYCDFCKDDKIGFFRLTNNESKDIMKIIENSKKTLSKDKSIKSYTKDDLLKQVYIDEEIVQSLFDGLASKKNIILQGAPGVGKTYLAEKIAYARMGKEDQHRICAIQFHPNYTYEDFIIGYKPNDDGVFKLQNGIFMEFCNMASRDGKNDYYFIIDEINRGNLGKIFGEAFTLIDKDYRGVPLKLANNNKIIIPKNVYIIGLMNTADRSLAMLDFALRRRFKFFTLCPVFDNSKFKAEQKKLKNKQFDKIIDAVVELNKKIGNDPTLGDGFRIGHSYFCNKEGLNPNGLKSVVEDEIIPLLREYWFDDDDDVFESKIKDLRDALKTQNDNE